MTQVTVNNHNYFSGRLARDIHLTRPHFILHISYYDKAMNLCLVTTLLGLSRNYAVYSATASNYPAETKKSGNKLYIYVATNLLFYLARKKRESRRVYGTAVSGVIIHLN